MLNSWFGTKNDDKTNNPSRSTGLHRISTNTTEVLDDSLKPARRTPPTGFTSPHDAVLAQMRGQAPVEDTGDSLLRDDILENKDPHSGLSPTDSMPHDPSMRKEYLYDPYDGTPLGLLVPQGGSSNVGVSSTRRMDGGNKEEQWVHLSQVLDLQNEVAKMHLEMEGVGPGDGKGKGAGKGRGRGKGKGLADTNARERREWGESMRERKPKRSATGDSVGMDAHDGDEEGVYAAGDEENEIKRAREEQFANLADQFEGRKESIEEIMNKLDHLSKALTEFHTLETPTFEFSKTTSRQNSTTPDRTPQIQTKPSPFASATLPSAGFTNFPNTYPLRPVPPSMQRSRGPSTTALPLLAEQENSILPASFSRSPGPGKAKTAVSPLIVNTLEPGKQTHVMDSPDSMKGYRLPSES